ncbi:BTAD domain-containing putative transcriptional regulator [Dactylosporangium sp. CA-092794]|uniref:BTAD domain-containing putative transcriptional regulator n=1 Tax=Dactylosporangium sp. CA-092794 TaxID=3239929 RepID=UPI003D89BE06
MVPIAAVVDVRVLGRIEIIDPTATAADRGPAARRESADGGESVAPRESADGGESVTRRESAGGGELVARREVADRREAAGRRVTGDDLPRRARQVLGVLAARHDRVQSKDALADAVWGEDLPGNHAAALEHYVSVLRRTLEPGVPTAGSFIVTRAGGYVFATDRARLDLADLRAAAREAEADPRRIDVREYIVELARDLPFAEDEYADWAAPARAEVKAVLVAARLDLAEHALPTDPPRAQRHAREALSLEPYAERGYRLAMRAAAATGRTDEVLRWYDQCRRALADDLGIAPSPDTAALRDALLATAESARPTVDRRRADRRSHLAVVKTPPPPAGALGLARPGDEPAVVPPGRGADVAPPGGGPGVTPVAGIPPGGVSAPAGPGGLAGVPAGETPAAGQPSGSWSVLPAAGESDGEPSGGLSVLPAAGGSSGGLGGGLSVLPAAGGSSGGLGGGLSVLPAAGGSSGGLGGGLSVLPAAGGSSGGLGGGLAAPERAAFAGRVGELAALSGGPDVIHVVGPAGAGKSALLNRLRELNPDRVGVGRGPGPGGALRLGWLRGVLQQLRAPADGTLDAAMAERRHLRPAELDAIAGAVRRRGGDRAVVAIDDAEHLDAYSVAELRWLHERGLRVVVSYRYPSAVAERPLAALDADLVLRLGPLTGADLDPGELEASGGIPALVAAHRGLAPELATEVAMHLARQRTRWMPPAAWEVLRLTAALGSLRVEQLAAAAGLEIDDVLSAVDQLVHAHLLVEGPGGHVRHRSALIRTAVAAQVSVARSHHLRTKLA